MPMAAADLTAASSHASAIALRFARRELRAGARGFAVFLACLALGVMAIAGIGSVSRSLSDGLDREGRTINGGDIAVSLITREASGPEQAALSAEGRMSTVASLRGMARNEDGRSTLVEIKAVDGAYPLAGEVALDGGGALAPAIAERDGLAQAVADASLFAQLGLAPGAVIRLGEIALRLSAKLDSEPDKIAGGIGYGPRVMMSIDTLRRTGLVQPGSLVRWRYRLALPPDVAPEAVADRLAQEHPDAGWEVRTRDDASPEMKRNIERFTMFLTLVGLTALLVGGVGVANAVRAFVEGKRDTVATLKTLGATGGTVVSLYLAQTMILALLGIGLGLAIGAALPFVVAAGFASY